MVIMFLSYIFIATIYEMRLINHRDSSPATEYIVAADSSAQLFMRYFTSNPQISGLVAHPIVFDVLYIENTVCDNRI